jgi:hypothetical protein
MATTQLVLLGVPAFVNSVTSSTACSFTIDELVYDTASSIAVDLANNTTLPPAQWATVDVDSVTSGWTTIGPTFNSGAHVGGVYLADRLVKKYAALLAGYPGVPDEIYQHQAVLRANDVGVVTRYHGFKVVIVTAGVGSIVRVAFIRAGTSIPATLGPDIPMRWLDLADASVSDPKSNGFTTIDGTSPVGTVGALFLTAPTITNQAIPMEKYPRGLAW